MAVSLVLGALGAGAAAAHVAVTADGGLRWETSGRPAVLVSTTARWTNFRSRRQDRRNMEEAARLFPSYAWIYGEENTIEKMRRMGFNAMNPFALPTGILPLLPGYCPGLSPEGDFEQLNRLLKSFGWCKKGRTLLHPPRTADEWDPCLRELRALTNMPCCIDLYTSRPAMLSKSAAFVGERLDVDRLFYPNAGKGFSQTFRLTSETGRAALTSLYVKDAETYRALGVKPLAYKLLNEANYRDDSAEFNALLTATLRERLGNEVSDAVRTIEKQKLRERLMTEAMRDVRMALRKVEPGTPTFVQAHSEVWRQNWNGIDLYAMNRHMDIVSIGTGGYGYAQPERGERPSPALADIFGRYAFYRAQAKGKPLVASEAYFGGLGIDRTPWLEKMLWYQAAEGVSLVNLWEWNHPHAKPPKAPFALANALTCRPETWDSLPRIVRQLNELADFFPAGVRRAKTRLACLYSQPTQRFCPERLDVWCSAVAALELQQVRADAIFEEQLVPGADCRIGDYDVIVAAGVDEILPQTSECLVRWMDSGGRLVVVDSTLDRDEYGAPLPPETPRVLEHRNCRRLAENVSEPSGRKMLLDLLAQLGVRPFVTVADATTGGRPPFVRVVRAANADGLVGWFVANCTDESKLLTLAAAELDGAAAVQPFGSNAWPVVDGKMTILVPARFHALAVTGPAGDLVRRFGARAACALEQLNADFAAAVAADRARAPKRAAVPVDIASVANAGFDNRQGWEDGTAWDDARGRDLVGVPYHVQNFRHVDFDIIRFDFNRNRTTIALASKKRQTGLVRTEAIPLGGKPYRSLVLLGAAIHAKPGEVAATLEVRSADGACARVPLRVGRELGDWAVGENDAVLQSNCVWQADGKGLFFHEWENPRPSVPLESFSLLGGEGESAANVVAVSAVETRFSRRFANRLDLSAGKVLGKPDTASFLISGDGLKLNAKMFQEGVLRYLVRQPPLPSGEIPQFARAAAIARGLDARGEKCAVDPHCVTVAGRCQLNGAQASVATADEWAEIEIPLAEICKGVDANGRTVALSVLTRIGLGGQPRFEYRDVRIEY